MGGRRGVAGPLALAGQVEQLIEEDGDTQDDVGPEEKVEDHKVYVFEHEQGIESQDRHRVQYEIAKGFLEEKPAGVLEMPEIFANNALVLLAP